jgi:hypothetical protein
VLKTRADDSRVSQAANRGARLGTPGVGCWRCGSKCTEGFYGRTNGWAAPRRPVVIVGTARPALRKFPTIRYGQAGDHARTATYAPALQSHFANISGGVNHLKT